MLEIDIPGFGALKLEYLVCDFTGTLSADGSLLPGVRELFEDLSSLLTIHVVTADTFGRAQTELSEIPCLVTVLTGQNLDTQKEQYVKDLNAAFVVAIGNGANDRRMLNVSRLSIAVIESEGCAIDAVLNAKILARSIQEALSLLLNPQRIVATLRL
ncbi:MAG: ATPase P [Geobacteraceae bacterium]|nr:ATPase P [Geobacteraceae bacterium]